MGGEVVAVGAEGEVGDETLVKVDKRRIEPFAVGSDF